MSTDNHRPAKNSDTKPSDTMEVQRVALVTGAAERIGASIAHYLHQQGWRILIHYRQSHQSAKQLAERLNHQRADSAACFAADLNDMAQLQRLAHWARTHWQQLDLLVNNASSFYPTPIGSATENDWDDLMGSNLKAPFFLAQALAPELGRSHGSIINLVDIHADKPLREHPIYCAAKAGNRMLVQALAKELAPQVRVNGVAPGAIMWPEDLDIQGQQNILNKIPLQRSGEPLDIAKTVYFLATQAPYITGQILAVDGGRSLNH